MADLLCFVLMPFGAKPDGTGRTIDFDAVYREVIDPAVRHAGMMPLRADAETSGGIIHKPMFERLMLCDYAVADLTGANANVFYELGIRHAARPHTTVPIFAGDTRLPFDVNFLRAMPYGVDPGGKLTDASTARDALASNLRTARDAAKDAPLLDSPVFQLLDWWKSPDVAHAKDAMLAHAFEHSKTAGRLDEARDLVAPARTDREAHLAEATERMRQVQVELGVVADAPAGLVLQLLYTYRALGTRGGWEAMIALVEAMGAELRSTAVVQEQLAFAVNRLKRHAEAARILEAVLKEHGPSSETLGLLGRVYKDQWETAGRRPEDPLAEGYLAKAIRTYLRGFDTDLRDTYPGINAATLMAIAGPDRVQRMRLEPGHTLDRVLPVVRYAAERRAAREGADYWDHATVLEAAVIAGDRAAAEAACQDALPLRSEAWMGETTARNLRLLREASTDPWPAWAKALEDVLAVR